MKMVMVAYNEALDEEVLELFDKAGVKGYTKWSKVHGKGIASDPHLGTHVWPKANNVLAAAVEDSQAGTLLNNIRELRKTSGREGVKAFVIPVEDVT